MSVTAGESKNMSGDDNYMSELRELASQISPQGVQRSVMKLLLSLKAQTGLGSLSYRINILEILLQDAKYISDQTLRERFTGALRRYWGVLQQQLDNPITSTQIFIALIQRFYSNIGSKDTRDMFYEGESIYQIFKDSKPEQLHARNEMFKDLRLFVNRATDSLQKMEIEDVLQRLVILTEDLDFFSNADWVPKKKELGIGNFTEKELGAINQVLAQAISLQSKLTIFMNEQNAAKKEATDNLQMPKHIRRRIKDFVGMILILRL